MTPTEIAALAGKLSDGKRAALTITPAWGFPAGHNNYPDVEYHRLADEDTFICAGEDVDACIRAGLLSVGEREPENGTHLIDEERDCEARWPIDITPLGLALRAYLQDHANG